jgi:hypothetical protein
MVSCSKNGIGKCEAIKMILKKGTTQFIREIGFKIDKSKSNVEYLEHRVTLLLSIRN